MITTSQQRVLITGVTGMLGSKVFEVGRELSYEIYGTTRRPLAQEHFNNQLFSQDHIVLLDPTQTSSIEHVLDTIQPQAVINCLGVIKSANVHVNDEEMIAINSTFPHKLAQACSARNIRLVQISTDCVFSGKRGNYCEQDEPDPTDLYGKTKLDGEIYDAPHLTIRTSIIGIERGTNKSLISWFLSNPQGSTLRGYTNAIWSGFTTRALATILYDLAIGKHRGIVGLLHVASEPISKYELLLLFKQTLHHNVNIEPYTDFHCDRSLCAHKMHELHLTARSHQQMLEELAEKDL